MKLVPLSQGLFAKVDDLDFDIVSKFKWCAQKRKHGHHAARYFGKKYVYMHQMILATEKGVGVDHKDGDGLNNMRDNLRPATKRDNGRGFRHLKGKTSKFRGVCWHKAAQKWAVALTLVRSKTLYLGLYLDEVEAARVYDAAAREHYGAFATPNFPS